MADLDDIRRQLQILPEEPTTTKVTIPATEDIKIPDITEAVKPVEERVSPRAVKFLTGSDVTISYGDITFTPYRGDMSFIADRIYEGDFQMFRQAYEPPADPTDEAVPCPICGLIWCMSYEAQEARVVAARIRKHGR